MSLMKTIKKIASLLALTLLIGLLVGTTAQAAGLSDLASLFETRGDELSFAEYEPGGSFELAEEGYAEALTTTGDVKDFVITVVNFLLGFLGLLAVIIVIYGGILYVTAAGEDEKTQKGKKAITYAAIGLLIVMGSFAFVNTIIRGAGGEGEAERQYVVGANVGGSFNASAIQVRNIAEDIYEGFANIAEATEEFKDIQSDAIAADLDYRNTLVSQGDVLNFLNNTRQKLRSMSSAVPRFSSAYVRINELIRVIELDINYIENLEDNTYTKITGDGKVSVCHPVDDPEELDSDVTSVDVEERPGVETLKGIKEDLLDLLGEGFDGVVCAYDYDLYPIDLYLKWKDEIQPNMISKDAANEKSPAYVLEALKADYKEEVIENLFEIREIRDSLGGIDIVETGTIGETYNRMMDNNNYGFDETGQFNSGFLGAIDDWSLDTNIDVVGNTLFGALETQLELADELQKLQSVEAHLRANVTSGNAPLVVTFDVVDSVDPAGGTIVDANVDWTNLAGSATFEGEDVDIGDAVNCADADEEIYGPTYRQCTFKYPGTYVSTVTIKSNDPTKYVPGTSSLIIKVNPPTTQIELTLEVGGKEIPVMAYYENGVLKLDKDYIPVTLSEAKDGIVFDASETENVANFKWDFGNNQIVDGAGDAYGEQKIEYDEAGRYRVELEVMNQLGEVDRKIFTLDVRNVAARIQVTPSEDVFIDTPVIIDGTLSSATSGRIKAYEWTIVKIEKDEELEIDIGANANQGSFTHEFQEPGKYRIDLKVTSELESVSADPYTVIVESKPPVALFDYEVPASNQPSTFKLNADKSYDPDGEKKDLAYEWTITPKTFDLVDNSTLTQKDPLIKFNEKDDYEVTLRVIDTTTKGVSIVEEFGEVTQTVTVDNILDVSWAEDQDVTAILDEEGEAIVKFRIESENAIAYEIDFGDGDVSSGDIVASKTIPHTYKEAGQYTVEVTVYDAEDNDNSIRRRVFVGGGEDPIAKIGMFINGVEIADLSREVTVNKKDIITFDASESKNTDGTGRDLKYSWDFGDTGRSSNKSATHSYKELSPEDPGYYLVKLTVYDKDEPDKEAEDRIKIKVVSKPPKISSIQAVPDPGSADLVTPVVVNVRAFGAEDEDGQITQYKWWYYNTTDPSEPLGIQITQTPSAKLTIGTKGREGDEMTYGFGLEVIDSDNLKASTEDFAEEQIPTLTVTNGPNEMPTAKFDVTATSVFTGDKVTFTSASSDPDGSIINYIWDLEGDGFFNNAPTDQSSIEHVYEETNQLGYKVKLKVIDDKGGEAISEVVTIYVDTLAEPPTAAFKYDVIEGSDGKKIQFVNNSTADEEAGAELIGYKWDFDTDSDLPTADSDGDGTKDNDSDSTESAPSILYTEYGTFKVKLIVTDDQGNTDEVTNNVEIIGEIPDITEPITPGEPDITRTTPEPAQIDAILSTNPAPANDGVIYLPGTSGSVTFDFSDSIGAISYYVLDKNIYFDTNGDGINNNDQDFRTSLPGTWKTNFEKEWGKIVVRLTITDIHGNEDAVTQEIKFQ